ncbi:hypothetical protein PG991_008735 [Apiospora marii]|uniref:Uncharacterized protein n=1 Tax=Apiospora marii TaxID=335849 RepID=A0ABR1RM21_9PEZI
MFSLGQGHGAKIGPTLREHAARLEAPTGPERGLALFRPKTFNLVRGEVPPLLRVRHVLDPAEAQAVRPLLAAHAQEKDSPLSAERVRQVQECAMNGISGRLVLRDGHQFQHAALAVKGGGPAAPGDPGELKAPDTVRKILFGPVKQQEECVGAPDFVERHGTRPQLTSPDGRDVDLGRADGSPGAGQQGRSAWVFRSLEDAVAKGALQRETDAQARAARVIAIP